MKQSLYQNYEELPLFLNSKIGGPGKKQRSGFVGERRSSGMIEFSPFGAEMRDMELATTKSRIKAWCHLASHNCPQCGQ